MQSAIEPPRRRRRGITSLIVLFAILAGLWTAAWHFAAGKVEEAVAGWKVREARAGRVYACGSESMGGFPFGIHVRCAPATAELAAAQPPLSLQAGEVLVSARLWQPTVLTSTVTAPLSVRAPGGADAFTARWRHAQATVRGLPQAPRQVDIAIDGPVLDHALGAQGLRLFEAGRLNVQGTMLEGSVQTLPVIQLAVTMAGASAPGLHPAAVLPADVDMVAVLRGLKDFAPKPWAERFRELQAAGGRIQVSRARIQQGDSVAVAQGELGLSPNGRLDGQLQLTVAGIEPLLTAFGLDKALPKAAGDQMGAAFGALDRIAPGLGSLARQNAGPVLAMGLAFIGKPTELEGRSAVALPLRFSDGTASLGPVVLGEVPAFY